MPLRIRLAAARRDKRCDFFEAAALVAAVQFTCNLGSEVSEEVGHSEETAANDSRSNFGDAAAVSKVSYFAEKTTYVHRATGKR